MGTSGRAWWAPSSQFQLQRGWGGAVLGGTEPLQRHALHPGTWGAGATSRLPSHPLRPEPLPGWQGPGRRAAPDPHPHHPALALLLLPGGCPSRLLAAPLSPPDHTLPPRNPRRPVHCVGPQFSSEHRYSSVPPPGNPRTHRLAGLWNRHQAWAQQFTTHLLASIAGLSTALHPVPSGGRFSGPPTGWAPGPPCEAMLPDRRAYLAHSRGCWLPPPPASSLAPDALAPRGLLGTWGPAAVEGVED